MPETKIAFRESGSGHPLLLLHGYAGSVLHWDHVVAGIGNHYQVIVPNLTHVFMGRNALTFSEQIEILAKFIKLNFPNKKIHLAGISYGGALVWGIALKYPELVDKTIFINPMPPKPVSYFAIPTLKAIFKLPLNMKAIYMLLRTPVGAMFLKSAAKVFRIERAEFWQNNHELKGRKLLVICQIIHRFSYILKNENWNLWMDRLQAWVHPSLLIYDFEDALFTPKTYHHFQDLIGCDEVEEVHLAGHIAIQTRGPEIAEMMLQFLDVKARTTAA
jgi:pimeloyl-ACP methyl ester carboxylesterase